MASTTKAQLLLGLFASGLTLGANSAMAQDDEVIEEIQVKGYRGTLIRSLDAKRMAVNSRESIVAEDIGKFPDLNLAEAIQRTPGVAISREGGEGRQLTIRGLGPQFTRVTLNGMEVPGSTDGLDSSGGLNSRRSFDFNIFASELFTRIDIQKSPTASVEEGGLAGTVDLHTPRPFDNPGFHATVAGQIGWNDLTEETDPRYSAVISNTFADDTFGVLVSLAKTERNVRQEGFGTVRWTSPTANDRTWLDSAGTVVEGSVNVPTLNDVWIPRLPRTDYFGNTQDRLGGTAALQWRPTDEVEISFDYAHSEFENFRESYNFFSMFRNEFDSITPLTLVMDPSGRYAEAGTFDGVAARSESRITISDTKFDQYVLSGSYDISDRFVVKAMVGKAESDFAVEQYRFNMTTVGRYTFGYDFRANSNIAEMEYGYDILDPANFGFTSPTIQLNELTRENTTARLDFELDYEDSVLRFGLISNSREVDALESGISGFTTPPSAQGLLVPVPVSDFGTGLSAPSGFPSSFPVADFGPTVDAYDIGTWVPRPSDGGTWNVEEDTLGLYVDFDTEATLLDRPLRVNAGVRVVKTDATMTGAIPDPVAGGFQPAVIENDYTDVLPSLNVVWELNDELQVRLNTSRTLTRPTLGSLSPTAAISGINGTISGGNPALDPMRANSADISIEWYFAEEALLSAAYFYKDIQSFIATDSVERLLDPVYADAVLNDPAYDAQTWVDPVNETYIHSVPLNNDGAELDGFELVYQQPFSNLPGFWSDFGVVANYTWVDSDSEYGTGATPVISKLVGLSEDSWNLTLYYETDRYGARISANSRDDYVTRVPGRNGNGTESTSGSTHTDVSAFYHINDNWTATFEIVNLTDEEERLFVTGLGDMDLVREWNHTGRQMFFGVRASFE